MTRKTRRPPTPAGRCAIYARVSSEDQARKTCVSVPEQIRQGHELADRMGLAVARVYVDDKRYRSEKSGRLVEPSGERVDRPGFRQMKAEAGVEWGTLVAWRQDRICRGLSATAAFEETLKESGIAVQLVTQAFDPEMMGILGAIDGRELSVIRRRMLMGREGHVRDGIHMGDTPMGYERVYDASGDFAGYRMLPAWRPFFAKLARLFLAREPLTEIARRLGNNPQTGKPYQHSTVVYLLRNPFYRGKLAYGRSRRPAEKVIHARAKHEPAWDPATCQAIERELERRAGQGRRGPRRRKWDYALSGVLHCGDCGRMLARTNTGKVGPRGRQYRGYACGQPRYARTGLIQEEPHEPNSISELKALALVADLLAALSPADIDRYLSLVGNSAEQGAERLAHLQAEADRLAARCAELAAALKVVAGTAGDVLAADLARSERELADVRRELAQGQASTQAADRDELRRRMLELVGGPDLLELTYPEQVEFCRKLPPLYVLAGQLVSPPAAPQRGVPPPAM